MLSAPENLRALITYFGISQQELADALEINASQISRWLSGERRLTAASVHMPRITEYFLSLATTLSDIDWLNRQLESEGLPTDASSVAGIRQNLTIWLSSDGEALRRNLGAVPPSSRLKKNKPLPPPTLSCSEIKLGALELSLALRPILSELPPKSCVNVFLSSDVITAIIDESVAGLLLFFADKKSLQIRLVACVSGDTRAMSRLIAAYTGALVSGHMQLSVVHGMTQTVTHQMHLIVPERCAVPYW